MSYLLTHGSRNIKLNPFHDEQGWQQLNFYSGMLKKLIGSKISLIITGSGKRFREMHREIALYGGAFLGVPIISTDLLGTITSTIDSDNPGETTILIEDDYVLSIDNFIPLWELVYPDEMWRIIKRLEKWEPAGDKLFFTGRPVMRALGYNVSRTACLYELNSKKKEIEPIMDLSDYGLDTT